MTEFVEVLRHQCPNELPDEIGNVVDRHKIHGEKDQHTKQMRWWLTEIK